MAEINPRALDKTGKVVLDQVYDKDTPLSFYKAVAQLDYAVPQGAKPVFLSLIEFLQQQTGREELKVIDLGSSYGVNGALLKYNLSLNEIFSHYRKARQDGLGRTALMQRDRDWISLRDARELEVVGVDVSGPALSYALDAQLIDAKVEGNFEEQDLSFKQIAAVAGADLVISTGCIGYVTAKTIAAVLEAVAPRQPLMAHYVLRTFSFEDVAAMAAARGYVTRKGARPIRQRRFASSEEQEQALARLAALSIEAAGMEASGWYYADLYLSLPASMADLPLTPFLEKQFQAD